MPEASPVNGMTFQNPQETHLAVWPPAESSQGSGARRALITPTCLVGDFTRNVDGKGIEKGRSVPSWCRSGGNARGGGTWQAVSGPQGGAFRGLPPGPSECPSAVSSASEASAGLSDRPAAMGAIRVYGQGSAPSLPPSRSAGGASSRYRESARRTVDGYPSPG
jgi:hypothetical protein